MAKKLLNKTKKQIVKELKENQDDGKRNITFSLPIDLIDHFKSDCKRNNLTMNRVVEKLIAEFLKS